MDPTGEKCMESLSSVFTLKTKRSHWGNGLGTFCGISQTHHSSNLIVLTMPLQPYHVYTIPHTHGLINVMVLENLVEVSTSKYEK